MKRGAKKTEPKKSRLKISHVTPEDNVIVPESIIYTADEGSHEEDTQTGFISMDLEIKIANFYEEHPMFYDLGHPDYKNKVKKDAALKTFADSVGLTRKYII